MVATDPNTKSFFVDRNGKSLAVCGYFSRITALHSFRQAVETFGLKVSGLPVVDFQEVDTVLKSLSQSHNLSAEELGELLTALKGIRENLDSFLIKPGVSFDPVSGGIVFRASPGGSQNTSRFLFLPGHRRSIFQFDSGTASNFTRTGSGTYLGLFGTKEQGSNSATEPLIFEIKGKFQKGFPNCPGASQERRFEVAVCYPRFNAKQMESFWRNLTLYDGYSCSDEGSFIVSGSLYFKYNPADQDRRIRLLGAQAKIIAIRGNETLEFNGPVRLNMEDGSTRLEQRGLGKVSIVTPKSSYRFTV